MQIVLFEEDIYYYPDATYHVETANVSFVKFAVMLKQMGIRNSAFCLTLLDRRLVNVDPFKPNNQEEMDWVTAECARNPWYIVREILRTPEGGDPIRANRGIISFCWLFFNGVSIIHTQPRQTGKSLVMNIIKVLLANFYYDSTTINVLTLNDNLRDETATKLKRMLANIPQYLNQRTKHDTDASESIKIGSKKNVVRYWLPRSDEPNARNVCRGSSGGALLADEPPFQPNFHISWPAAQNSCNAEFARLENSNQLFGEGILSTSGVTTTKPGEFVYNLIQKSATFNERLYDCKNREELHEVIRRSGRGILRVYAEYNALQLGYTKEQLRQLVLKNSGTDDQIAMELFNNWQTGDGSCPFRPDLLMKMQQSAKEPLYVEIDEKSKFVFNWYVEESKLETYLKTASFVLTLDMSEASGGDDISVMAVDISTLEVVGAGTINVTNTFVMTLWFAKFFVRMPKMVCVAEAKSLGVSVIHFLLDYLPSIGEDPFARIFNWVVNNKNMTSSDGERFRTATRNRGSAQALREWQGEFGYKTSGGTGEQSRHMLYNVTLRDFAQLAADGMNNIKLITQTTRLESINGRIDHRKGEHDDTVIGWVLAGWFLHHAKNKDYYAIDSDQVMRSVREKEIANLDHNAIAVHAHNSKITKLIEDKLEELKRTRDDYLAKSIEDSIRYLEKKLDNSLDGSTPLNVDDLLESAKREADSYSYNSYTQTDYFSRRSSYNPYNSFF